MDIVASGLGGVIIGASAGSLWLLQGRIAGISGISGRLVKGCVGVSPTSKSELFWRACFIVGLLLGGFALHQVFPAAFPRASFSSSTNTDSLAVLIIGGLLVGYGTQLGNGCTSGHGVCGLSRGSIRSFAATMTFMLTGSITSALARSFFQANKLSAVASVSFWQSAFTGSIHSIAPISNSSLSDLQVPLILASAAFLAMFLFAALRVKSEQFAASIAALPGFTFGIGLGLSGMTNPAKVLGFLDPFGRQWDPSLMFVMGGALAVNTAIYAFSRRLNRPYLGHRITGCKFDAPQTSQITGELIVGAAMFGVGWGLAGRCPGPVLLRTVEAFFDLQQAFPTLVFVGALIAGIFLHHVAPLTFTKVKAI